MHNEHVQLSKETIFPVTIIKEERKWTGTAPVISWSLLTRFFFNQSLT